jgi:hypothetical protein
MTARLAGERQALARFVLRDYVPVLYRGPADSRPDAKPSKFCANSRDEERAL